MARSAGRFQCAILGGKFGAVGFLYTLNIVRTALMARSKGVDGSLESFAVVPKLNGIQGHGANTVAANYGLGYALGVMREQLEKVWRL